MDVDKPTDSDQVFPEPISEPLNASPSASATLTGSSVASVSASLTAPLGLTNLRFPTFPTFPMHVTSFDSFVRCDKHVFGVHYGEPDVIVNFPNSKETPHPTKRKAKDFKQVSWLNPESIHLLCWQFLDELEDSVVGNMNVDQMGGIINLTQALYFGPRMKFPVASPWPYSLDRAGQRSVSIFRA
uniref:Uncharacterized protein n=1 Tax=Mycena chlorophos TaxID=658473 RepID=A0ABQ0KYR2_MYCCL|nr:predicted protein [Mycena chlorophos]